MTAQSGRAFLKLKFAWLDQVLSDAGISPQAFQLAYVLATRFLDRKSGEAWPSRRTLAGLLHTTDRHITRLSHELRDAGHLTITVANRQHVSNRYRPIVRDDKSVTPQTVQGGQIRHPSGNPGVTMEAFQGCQIRHPTPLKRTLKSSHNGNSLNGATKTYAFEGRVIRLDQAQKEKWQSAFPELHDIEAVLQSADDYYSEHPPPDGKWFHRVSRWLASENGKRADKRRAIERNNASW